MERFDLIAIGGGTAGLVSAAGAASLGLRAALIEQNVLGGDCLWTGCVPSKAMIASAKAAHLVRGADRFGLPASDPTGTFHSVMERMRAVRNRVAVHDDPERFRKMGVEVISGHAEFVAPDRVRVDGRTLGAKRIVIATGATPAVPPIAGLTEAGYLTHATVFDQDDLPSHVAVLGGGPIGVEFAQIYRRLGAQVTILEMLPQLLPAEDPEAGALVGGVLSSEGIRVITGARVERVDGVGGRKCVTASGPGGTVEVEADEILVATGRRPNTARLGLEAAGIALERGAVKVDASLATTARGVWAAGDVAGGGGGGPQFTHVADYQAKLVLRNAVFPFSSKADYSMVPAVTYADPEIASVGLTDTAARERHRGVASYRYDLTELDRAIVDGAPVGFVKVVTGKSGRILGATIVARRAGEMIVPIVMAMKHRIALPKLSRLVFPYPTWSEGLKRTADGYYREKFAGKSGDMLRRVVRWLR